MKPVYTLAPFVIKKALLPPAAKLNLFLIHQNHVFLSFDGNTQKQLPPSSIPRQSFTPYDETLAPYNMNFLVSQLASHDNSPVHLCKALHAEPALPERLISCIKNALTSSSQKISHLLIPIDLGKNLGKTFGYCTGLRPHWIILVVDATRPSKTENPTLTFTCFDPMHSEDVTTATLLPTLQKFNPDRPASAITFITSPCQSDLINSGPWCVEFIHHFIQNKANIELTQGRLQAAYQRDNKLLSFQKARHQALFEQPIGSNDSLLSPGPSEFDDYSFAGTPRESANHSFVSVEIEQTPAAPKPTLWQKFVAFLKKGFLRTPAKASAPSLSNLVAWFKRHLT